MTTAPEPMALRWTAHVRIETSAPLDLASWSQAAEREHILLGIDATAERSHVLADFEGVALSSDPAEHRDPANPVGVLQGATDKVLRIIGPDVPFTWLGLSYDRE